MVTTKRENHPKASETSRKHLKFFATNQSQTTQNEL